MPKLPIDSIKVNPDRRQHSQHSIEALAESIGDIGQLHPIVVLPDNTLVAGMGRLEACKRLGMTDIEVIVKDYTPEEAVLAMHMENMRRTDYGIIEQAMAIAQCKEAYDQLKQRKRHKPQPQEPKASCEHQECQSITDAATNGIPFDEVVATNLGVSPRTVRRDLFIAHNIHPSVREAVRDTKVQYTRRDIEKVARLSPQDQEEVARLLKHRECLRIPDAVEAVNGTPHISWVLATELKKQNVTLDDENKELLARFPTTIQKTIATKMKNGMAFKDALSEIVLYDVRKQRIPPHLAGRWIATKEILSHWSKQLTCLLNEVRRFASSINGRYLDMLTLSRDIANCKHALKFAAPYLLCKTCKGRGCDVCRHTGWLPRHTLTRNAEASEDEDTTEEVATDL